MLEKYCVLKWAELRRLPEELQKQFETILNHVVAVRQQSQAPTDDYFVLNLKDKYSQGGIEGYINAVESDVVNKHNPGVVDAVTYARQQRTKMMLKVRKGLPT